MFEHEPNPFLHEQARQVIVDRVDELLEGVQYTESTDYKDGVLYRGVSSLFAKRLYRRADLQTNNYGEEIIVREYSVRILGKVKPTKIEIAAVNTAAGDGRFGYPVAWAYEILTDLEVPLHSELIQHVLSADIDERTQAVNQLREVGLGLA